MPADLDKMHKYTKILIGKQFSKILEHLNNNDFYISLTSDPDYVNKYDFAGGLPDIVNNYTRIEQNPNSSDAAKQYNALSSLIDLYDNVLKHPPKYLSKPSDLVERVNGITSEYTEIKDNNKLTTGNLNYFIPEINQLNNLLSSIPETVHSLGFTVSTDIENQIKELADLKNSISLTVDASVRQSIDLGDSQSSTGTEAMSDEVGSMESSFNSDSPSLEEMISNSGSFASNSSLSDLLDESYEKAIKDLESSVKAPDNVSQDQTKSVKKSVRFSEYSTEREHEKVKVTKVSDDQRPGRSKKHETLLENIDHVVKTKEQDSPNRSVGKSNVTPKTPDNVEQAKSSVKKSVRFSEYSTEREHEKVKVTKVSDDPRPGRSKKHETLLENIDHVVKTKTEDDPNKDSEQTKKNPKGPGKK